MTTICRVACATIAAALFVQPVIAQTSGAIAGEVRAFAISEADANSLNGLYSRGWVPADGRSLPKKQFTLLFAAVGETWGKPQDAASFVIPDLRGVFLRGYNGESVRDPDASTRTSSAPGGTSGNRVGSYQDDAVQLHRHQDMGHDHALNQNTYNNQHYGAGPYEISKGPPLRSGTGFARISDPTEARTSIESRPKNVAVYYFVYTGRAVPPALRALP